jgi:hypothetical protein
MSVGNQASTGSINSQLSSMAISLRNILTSVEQFQEFVVAQGQSGLEALGYDSTDATTVLNMASYMNTVAGVYFGTATQGTQFDFDNALCGLWAGQ